MDLETLKWLLAASGPALFIFWTWWIKRQADRDKRVSDGFSYNQAKDASIQAYGEGMRKDASSQLAEITSQALQQNYKLNDGMLSRMFEAVTAGNLAQAEQQTKVLSGINQLAMSLNKTIEQQAKLLDVLLEISHGEGQSVASALLKTAKITTPIEPELEDKQAKPGRAR